MDLGFTWDEFLNITVAEIQVMFELLGMRRRAEAYRELELRADIRTGARVRNDGKAWTPQDLGAPQPPRRAKDKELWEVADNIAEQLKRGNLPAPKWATWKSGRKKVAESHAEQQHPRASKRRSSS